MIEYVPIEHAFMSTMVLNSENQSAIQMFYFHSMIIVCIHIIYCDCNGYIGNILVKKCCGLLTCLQSVQ